MARTRYSATYTAGRAALDGQRRKRLDPATLLGLVAAFGLVALAMAIGGSPESFFDAPALLIVLGGTLGVTTIAFSLDDVLRTQSVVARTIFRAAPQPEQTARQMIFLPSATSRRSALLQCMWKETIRKST